VKPSRPQPVNLKRADEPTRAATTDRGASRRAHQQSPRCCCFGLRGFTNKYAKLAVCAKTRLGGSDGRKPTPHRASERPSALMCERRLAGNALLPIAWVCLLPQGVSGSACKELGWTADVDFVALVSVAGRTVRTAPASDR
jgi:hypothetical protein